MKPTAQLLGLFFATLAVTAVAADTPAPAVLEAAPPAVSQSNPSNGASEPVKAEPSAVTTPDLSPPNGPAAPAPFSPLVHPEPEEKPADPNVLEMPKMVVKQKPRPRLTPEIMVTRKAFGEDLARQKFTQLDQILNKFTLPLFGSSLAERALDEHEREKKQEMKFDVLNMVQALETADPNEAKSLKEAVTRP